MLLGNWKDFTELEESLSLPELEAMLKAYREREYRAHRFAAALKGIDLEGDTPQEDAQLRQQIIEQRAQARIRGEDPETAEWSVLGIQYVSEDE